MNRNTIAAITVSALLIGIPLATFAQTTSVQDQINALLTQIKTLQAQLADLLKQQPAPTPVSPTPPEQSRRICALLNRNLSQGSSGDDVSGLQDFLNTQGFLSVNATGFFGPMTAQAVAKWQASEGVSSVGSVGPLSRERIKIWCGTPTPVPPPPFTGCKPINYMPILCDGSTPAQPVHDSNGCIVKYECPAVGFTPPVNCKAWNDGCNECSRATPNSPAACTMRACLMTTDTNTGATQGIWAGKGYCSAYFDDTSGNRPPTISSFSGPTTLTVNQSGTWSVGASDPQNGQLTYQISWGDESNMMTPQAGGSMMAVQFVQNTTFTHTYSSAGLYNVKINVSSPGGVSSASATVQVGNAIACTMEYAPVCGQPAEPACRHSVPACMIATQGPQTYGNRCMLNAAGATFISNGACGTSY